jgi:hypothetical protein
VLGRVQRCGGEQAKVAHKLAQARLKRAQQDEQTRTNFILLTRQTQRKIEEGKTAVLNDNKNDTAFNFARVLIFEPNVCATCLGALVTARGRHRRCGELPLVVGRLAGASPGRT